MSIQLKSRSEIPEIDIKEKIDIHAIFNIKDSDVNFLNDLLKLFIKKINDLPNYDYYTCIMYYMYYTYSLKRFSIVTEMLNDDKYCKLIKYFDYVIFISICIWICKLNITNSEIFDQLNNDIFNKFLNNSLKIKEYYENEIQNENYEEIYEKYKNTNHMRSVVKKFLNDINFETNDNNYIIDPNTIFKNCHYKEVILGYYNFFPLKEIGFEQSDSLREIINTHNYYGTIDYDNKKDSVYKSIQSDYVTIYKKFRKFLLGYVIFDTGGISTDDFNTLYLYLTYFIVHTGLVYNKAIDIPLHKIFAEHININIDKDKIMQGGFNKYNLFL